ncbi:MAG: hypothetical protein WC670_18370 [Pseudolabrys sp.]|jgi:hypothetical protein
MRVSKGFPPMYSEIHRVFNVRGKPILFAWGDTIFAPPPAGPLTPALHAHEGVHGLRQMAHSGGPAGWWRAYIDDPRFRLFEEVPAHQAEYRWHELHSGRHGRDQALESIARRLSSPLYGSLVTFEQAKKLLSERAEPDMVAL